MSSHAPIAATIPTTDRDGAAQTPEYDCSKPDKYGECGFCYPREQGTHGEVRRVWSTEWMQYIPLCRKHAAGI